MRGRLRDKGEGGGGVAYCLSGVWGYKEGTCARFFVFWLASGCVYLCLNVCVCFCLFAGLAVTVSEYLHFRIHGFEGVSISVCWCVGVSVWVHLLYVSPNILLCCCIIVILILTQSYRKLR